MTFCQKSIQHFNQILKTNRAHTILIGVKGGGCNGLQYSVNPIEKKKDLHDLDQAIQIENTSIHVCHKSIVYLIGTHVEWKETAISQGIHFNNPNIANSCGCGETFSIK